MVNVTGTVTGAPLVPEWVTRVTTGTAGGFDPDETSRREHLHVDRHQVLDIRSQAAEVEDQVRRGLREAREPYVGPRALGVQIGARRVQTGGHRFDDLVRGRRIDAEDRLLGFGGDPLVEDKLAFLRFGGRGKDFLLAQEGQYRWYTALRSRR